MGKKSKRFSGDSKITGGKIWIEIELEIDGGKDDDPVNLNDEMNGAWEFIYWENLEDFTAALLALEALSASYYGRNKGPFSAGEILECIEDWKELNA